MFTILELLFGIIVRPLVSAFVTLIGAMSDVVADLFHITLYGRFKSRFGRMAAFVCTAAIAIGASIVVVVGLTYAGLLFLKW